MHAYWEQARRTRARVAMPIAVYPGAALTGARVRALVTDPAAQAAASLAIRRRFRTAAVMSAMDLSVEAEAFGCPVQMSEDEVPTVIQGIGAGRESVADLRVPAPGDGRTRVYLETVGRLRQAAPDALVLGGCIGPFSLASRLIGMSEALGLTIEDPERLHAWLDRATAFLSAYVRAFREAGADGVVMAEPGAGLLSPKALLAFSSTYVRRIIEASAADGFEMVLHNCAAKRVHLGAILESGAKVLHFGAPMDLVAALEQVPPEVTVCGNLDPTSVFFQASAAEVREQTRALLDATADRPNLVLSSGCDVPPGSPLSILEAFFETVAAFNAGRS